MPEWPTPGYCRLPPGLWSPRGYCIDLRQTEPGGAVLASAYALVEPLNPAEGGHPRHETVQISSEYPSPAAPSMRLFHVLGNQARGLGRNRDGHYPGTQAVPGRNAVRWSHAGAVRLVLIRR